jgi:hypothetical protein
MSNRTFAAAAAAACAVLVLAVGASAVQLDNPTQTMYLTFSAPVALPGVTLGAGTYVFERLAPPTLVRVSSRDRRIVYLTAFTHLIERPAGLPADRYVMLRESRPGTAPPLRAWFPAGTSMGHEFIYNR